MQETDIEKTWCEEVENNEELSDDEKQKALKKLEKSFFHRRLINADYFKQLMALILTRDYI